MLTVIELFLVWPPIYSVYLTFPGCPGALFAFIAHVKRFRTWFSQMLLINA